MMRLTFFSLLALGLAIVWAGCDAAGVGEELSEAVLIEGRVTDASGDDVEGARVIVPPTEADLEDLAEGDPPPEPNTARTDSLGNYSLVININSGAELDIRVVKGELETSKVITVFPGQTKSDVDFVLGGDEGEDIPGNAESTFITGYVLSVSGGAPRSNARVVVTSGAAGGPFTARVDSITGAYSLEAQITDGTELTIEAISDLFTAQRVVTVFPDETRSNVDFVLGSGAFTVSGQVLDADGEPVSGVRVEADANEQTAGDEPFYTTTNGNGEYSLTVELTGSTELTIRAVLNQLQTERVVTASPNDVRSGFDFILGQSTGGGAATITGRVTDGSGSPLDDVRIVVASTEQTVGSQPFTTLTDVNGEYSLNVELLTSANLTVRAISGTREAEQTVTVVPGETEANVNFVLASSTGGGTATITGRVTDSQDNPVADARIEAPSTEQTVGDQPFTALTDANGQYSLDVELRTSTEVTVRAVRDDLSAERTITIVPGQTRADVDFVLGGAADETGVATIEGRVTDSGGDPISDARVEALANEETVSGQAISTRTDAVGSYSLDVEITSSTDLSIVATSDGLEAEQVVTVFPDETRNGVDFILSAPDGGGDGGDSGDTGEESGTPAVIQLLNVSRTVIGIQGSGSPETSTITYQVVDSAGRPVTLDHATPLRFSLSGASPLGATIDPQQVTTNNEGKATVNLSSGTEAGTVQIIAEATAADGSTIRSMPVSVTIHGGLPDQAHFSISTARNNIQGLVTNGLTVDVSVIVGDRHSNPVKPNTAVYFETTGGIIEGSILTDEQGRGTVQLISGNPRPTDGIAVISVSTQDRNGQRIEVKTPVLFTSGSRVKIISLPDTAFAQPLDLSSQADIEALYGALGSDFPLGGYRFIVTDRNGNPLPAGTTITFEAGGAEVGSEGAYTLDRTLITDQNGDGDALDYDDVVRGLGITEFSGVAVPQDDPETPVAPDLESFTIAISSPQAQRSYTFVEPDPSLSPSASQVILYENGEPAASLQNGEIVLK